MWVGGIELKLSAPRSLPGVSLSVASSVPGFALIGRVVIAAYVVR